MPRGIKKERSEFIQMTEQKAQRRKPMRAAIPVGKRGTLYAKRNTRLAIRESALRRMQCVIRYRKITTGETKKYICAPYELKYRRLKAGWRKMFWGYDMDDKHIKSFVMKEVKNVSITDRPYRPKWAVKFF